MSNSIDFERLQETGLYIPKDSVLSSEQHEAVVAAARATHNIRNVQPDLDDETLFAFIVASEFGAGSPKVPEQHSEKLNEAISYIESLVCNVLSDSLIH